ncbi:MAG: ATP-binding protein [Azonexus sp.]|nr:ATP-binding protein [Azonexus sp.]
MIQPNAPFILARQVDLLYRNLRLGQIVSVLNASLMVWIAHAQVAPTSLGSWWVLATMAAGIRMTTAARFYRCPVEERQQQAGLWRQRALLGAAASSLIWAGGALLLMVSGETTLQLFTAFVMAGMVAGAVPVLAADRLIFRVYAWPIVLAVALGTFGPDPLHIAFSVMSLLFLLISTRSADYFYNALQETLRLEQEKDALVTKLDLAREVAEQSNRAKTEFLANISHELRTPLNGIVGLGELLSLEELTTDQQQLLAPLRQSADELMQIITNLIELSGLEAGHITATPSPFMASELLDILLLTHRKAATIKGLALTSEIDPALPKVLVGDIERLRHVFAHLIGNAIKFTDQGSIDVSATVTASSPEQILVRFCIKDTGPGIPADKLKLLGGLMVQADGSSARRHGGIGVGLPIARKLIEILGGELEIDSQVGVGSNFCFTLPFKSFTEDQA